MYNIAARLPVLFVLLLGPGLTSAQLKWNKVTLSEEPNEDWIYYHRSTWAYNLPKGDTFQTTMAFLLTNEGNFDGFNIYHISDSSGKEPGADAPDGLMTFLHLQGNLLVYMRDGTFLGGTNLLHQTSSLLSTSELGFRDSLDEVEFYVEIPGCGLQRFTKKKDSHPTVLLEPLGRRGLKTTWSIANYADPECPEVFVAVQFVTSRDQFDLDQYYSIYYRVENWTGGYIMYPFDEHNDFMAEDAIISQKDTSVISSFEFVNFNDFGK